MEARCEFGSSMSDVGRLVESTCRRYKTIAPEATHAIRIHLLEATLYRASVMTYVQTLRREKVLSLPCSCYC